MKEDDIRGEKEDDLKDREGEEDSGLKDQHAQVTLVDPDKDSSKIYPADPGYHPDPGPPGNGVQVKKDSPVEDSSPGGGDQLYELKLVEKPTINLTGAAGTNCTVGGETFVKKADEEEEGGEMVP